MAASSRSGKWLLLFLSCAAFLAAQAAQARIPPPPVSMDRVLAQAGVIVIGKVQPGSWISPKEGYSEATLHVTSVLKGPAPDKEIKVVFGSIPARAFPKTKEHPEGRYLLTGWNHWGHIEEAPVGLDLCAEQVWFLEQFPDHPSLRAPKSPYGVSCFESVLHRRYAPLITHLAGKVRMTELRLTLAKGFGGEVPGFVVEALHGSGDPDVGPFLWECLKRLEEDGGKKSIESLAEEWRKEEEAKKHNLARPLRVTTVFRTLNSLGRDEALKWSRKALSRSPTTRHWSFETLKRYADTESVPALLKLLETPEADEEKEGLVQTLGIIGDARAVPALIERLCRLDGRDPRATQEALFRLTDLRLSPNGNLARAWWDRSKDRPRWHWLKQGMEQDLLLLPGTSTTDWRDDLQPRTHLERTACWRQDGDVDQAAAWKKWWNENRDLPQEQWLLDSFRAAGYPLPALDTAEAVDALIRILNTKTDYWRKGPTLDTYLHPVWCTRLLHRLTGLDVVDTHYFHHTENFYVNGEVYGPKWRELWEEKRKGIKLRPIEVPARQEFRLDDEDRRLIAQDLFALRVEVVREGPLLDVTPPKTKEKDLLATFVVTVTNTTDRELTLATKPGFTGTNKTVRWTSNLHTEDFVCLVKDEAVTLRPRDSLRWRTRQHVRFAEPTDPSRFQFHLSFRERGVGGDHWRGEVHTPWIAVSPDAPVEKPP